MSRLVRLCLPPEACAADAVDLDREAARRVRDVLRLRAGAALRVFDGSGVEREALVERADRGGVTLSLGATLEALAEPPLPVVLACAFPRGQRGDWLVEKATEAGACAFVLVDAERAVLRPGDGRVERWRRIAVEAAEQCGRAVVPRFLEAAPDGALHLLADLGNHPSIADMVAPALTTHRAVVLHVGPEGGWTEAERSSLLEAGARPVSLGPRTLRVETAAVLAVAEAVRALEAL